MLIDGELVLFLQLLNVVKDALDTIVTFIHELREVDVHEEADDNVAVESVSEAAVTRNALCEVLDFESSLKTGREETTKRCYDGGEECDDSCVNLGR